MCLELAQLCLDLVRADELGSIFADSRPNSATSSASPDAGRTTHPDATTPASMGDPTPKAMEVDAAGAGRIGAGPQRSNSPPDTIGGQPSAKQMGDIRARAKRNKLLPAPETALRRLTYTTQFSEASTPHLKAMPTRQVWGAPPVDVTAGSHQDFSTPNAAVGKRGDRKQY